jgi:glycosyltransferase involved in cell wall biosynthesis
MKIIHIELGRHMYGGARQVQFLLKGLQDYPVTNTLVTTKDSEVFDACQAFCQHSYALESKGDLDWNYLTQLRQIIRNEKPDFMQIHSRKGDMISIIAAKLEKTPVLMTRRVDNLEFFGASVIKYPLLEHVIAISHGIKKALVQSGVRSDKISVVHSAIAPPVHPSNLSRREFLNRFGLPSNALVVGVVAQLIKRKGHAVLFNGIPQILEKFPDTQFLIFGQGELKSELKQKTINLGIQHAVHFAGFQQDMPDLIPHFDILTHPALLEGLGVALLEAATAGVPIVASNSGGIPEIVHHRVNGLLVEPNHTDELISSLCELLGSQPKRQEMGNNGRTIAAQFSIESMVEGNFKIYQSLNLGSPYIEESRH